MLLVILTILSLFLHLSQPYPSASSAPSCPTVRASTGVYHGQINRRYPNVREFLNVPFGQSTAGSNRFMAPKPVPKSDSHFDATQYCPSCPQYVSRLPSIWNRQIPQYLVSNGAANHSTGMSNEFTSEECLSVAIWTPIDAKDGDQLPVAMFWTGGGYSTNGILVPGQLPGRWVSRSQEHIVITINYRMNILGFPNAAGAPDQNLGLLDQRLALEWARDNVHFFGGDPSRIMIWGQSAGAGSVDYHNYAFYDDPITHAIFAQSGNALGLTASGADPKHTNFTFVARHLGCDFPHNATKELQCMQGVDFNKVENFIGHYGDNQTQPALSFGPVIDEKIVFSNNSARYAQGKVSKVPMVYSSAANEGGSLSDYPVDNPLSGVNQTAANLVTERILCGAANSSLLRAGTGLTTYRYQYAGNWTNQDPLPWMGAYHSSDLVMFFGTYNDGVAPSHQPLEGKTSQVMEDFLLSFIKDPESGPPSMGWPHFIATADNGGTMLRFGADAKAVQQVSAVAVQGVCFGQGEYDPFP